MEKNLNQTNIKILTREEHRGWHPLKEKKISSVENMVIISIISDSGELKEQHIVREAEGMELFNDILRRYEDRGFIIHGGYIVKDYERGDVLLTKFGCDNLTVYVKKLEVTSTTSPKSYWDLCQT